MKFEQLVSTIQIASKELQLSAAKAVNVRLTIRNWLVGFYIVEFEQKGEDRAEYGSNLFTNLSTKINIKGLGVTNLKQCRQFYLMLVVNNVPSYSTSLPVIPYAALNAGTISPELSVIKAGTSASTFTATATSGGSMCGLGAYNYQWQISTDNVNWVAQSGTATNFSPGIISQKTYVRQKVSCGPLSEISNVAVIDVNKPLDPGTIMPGNRVVAVNTDPGILIGNPARNGNLPGSYTYLWQKSTKFDFSSGVTNITGAISLSYHPGIFSSTGITYSRRAVSCDGIWAYSNVVSIVCGSPTTDQNYVRSRDILKPVTTKEDADALTSTQDVIQLTQYYDALGR